MIYVHNTIMSHNRRRRKKKKNNNKITSYSHEWKHVKREREREREFMEVKWTHVGGGSRPLKCVKHK